MMTAYAVEELVQQASDEGGYGVLYKPLRIDKLLRMVEEIQKRKQLARDSKDI